jgi:hypothetical protein
MFGARVDTIDDMRQEKIVSYRAYEACPRPKRPVRTKRHCTKHAPLRRWHAPRTDAGTQRQVDQLGETTVTVGRGRHRQKRRQSLQMD